MLVEKKLGVQVNWLVTNVTYKTKDSGKRVKYSTGMNRDLEEGKPRYDLIIPIGIKDHMLKRWAELMDRGQQKYGYRNWELARTEDELIRFKSSAFRHFIQWFNDEDVEEDHAAAVFFNIQAAEYVKHKLKSGINEDSKSK